MFPEAQAGPQSPFDLHLLPPKLQPNTGTVAASLASIIGGIMILVPGLVLLTAFGACSAGCTSTGGPGSVPPHAPPVPPLGEWLMIGAIQTLLGGLILAAALVLLKRSSWHVALGVIVLGCSVADMFVAAVDPWYAGLFSVPIGYLAGFLGGALAIAWARPSAPLTVPSARRG